MTKRRLLNLRFYRQNPKRRARLHRRMFGFVAAARLNWKRRKAGILAPLLVLIAAVKSARISARYRARRKVSEPPAEKSPIRLRRPMSVRYTAHMLQLHRGRMAARFGVGGTADDRRLMRNARKAEREVLA
jgi:hypothetical protein